MATKNLFLPVLTENKSEQIYDETGEYRLQYHVSYNSSASKESNFTLNSSLASLDMGSPFSMRSSISNTTPLFSSLTSPLAQNSLLFASLTIDEQTKMVNDSKNNENKVNNGEKVKKKFNKKIKKEVNKKIKKEVNKKIKKEVKNVIVKKEVKNVIVKKEVKKEARKEIKKGVKYGKYEKKIGSNLKSSFISASNTVEKHGYTIKDKLSTTLQGSIYTAFNAKVGKNENNLVVIKRTSIKLHNSGMTKVNKDYIKIDENILKEKNILKYLKCLSSNSNLNLGLTFIIDFFFDKKNYYLVQNYGGICLFDYILTTHDHIDNGTMSVFQLKSITRYLFGQMVKTLHWLHTVAKCCHLDISLENCLFDIHTKKVSFCDFGLAECFPNENFLISKFVGKKPYKSYEVFGELGLFDARKADVWALGVCFFMMRFGFQPWIKPSYEDPSFSNIMNGHLIKILKSCSKENYADHIFFAIFDMIFTKHYTRALTSDLLKSQYFNTNFV